MIVKSDGLVLSYMKYGDTSIIARIFTKERGYGSYIVNGIRSQRTKKSIGYFQPFSLLELVLYVKDTRDLQRISEFKASRPLHHIHHDMVKSSITLFLTEVFSNLLRQEQTANVPLYDFVEASIIAFDALENHEANFHLQFLLKLGPYLGYAIDDIDNIYSSTGRLSPSSEEYSIIDALIKEPYGSEVPLSRTIRNQLLGTILTYYKHHAQLPDPKSLGILRSILD